MKSTFNDVTIPQSQSLAHFVLAGAAKLGQRPAIIDYDTAFRVSYDHLVTYSNNIAKNLVHEYEFKKGSVMAIYMPNYPLFAPLFLGTALAGGTCTFISHLTKAEELKRVLSDSGAEFMLTTTGEIGNLLDAFEADIPLKRIFFITTQPVEFGATVKLTDFLSLISTPAEEGPVKVDINVSKDAVALPYSAGVAGVPKGALITHQSMIANLVQLEEVEPFDEKDVIGIVVPFFQISGLLMLLKALWKGCTVVTMQKIDSDDFIRMAHHYKVEKAYMTPKMLSSIVKNEDLRQKQVMSKLNHIVTLESGLSPELQIEAAEKLQLRVKQAYALTEGQFLCFADNYKTILNSCGKVLPNTTVKVVKSSGEEVKVFGEVGELWFHGPQLMSGYCKDQQATHAVLKDGWLHTGDLGFVKEDGSVYILDRLKSMIKTQFGSVSPAELEEVIAKHPAVADVCVVGVPSIESYQEETIKAFVVCKPNQEANAEDIMQFVNNQVAANKQVKAVEFLDSIPKSPSGKVLRSILFKMRGLQ